MSSEAYVTLATNDSYALGALVLAQSIRQNGSNRCLVVMISRNVSNLIKFVKRKRKKKKEKNLF